MCSHFEYCCCQWYEAVQGHCRALYGLSSFARGLSNAKSTRERLPPHSYQRPLPWCHLISSLQCPPMKDKRERTTPAQLCWILLLGNLTVHGSPTVQVEVVPGSFSQPDGKAAQQLAQAAAEAMQSDQQRALPDGAEAPVEVSGPASRWPKDSANNSSQPNEASGSDPGRSDISDPGFQEVPEERPRGGDEAPSMKSAEEAGGSAAQGSSSRQAASSKDRAGNVVTQARGHRHDSESENWQHTRRSRGAGTVVADEVSLDEAQMGAMITASFDEL